MANARWGKNRSARGKNIQWFAGSFADRLNRQMGLSDLESSRDSLAAYNCHRRANEHSLVERASQKILLFLPTVPSFVPFLVHLATHRSPSFSIVAIASFFHSFPEFGSILCVAVVACFWRRCCRLAESFLAGVKAVNWECACNYATQTFYSFCYPLPSLTVAYMRRQQPSNSMNLRLLLPYPTTIILSPFFVSFPFVFPLFLFSSFCFLFHSFFHLCPISFPFFLIFAF